MNYYERYCGDYSRDTAHLSLAEHGAYSLMLDAYYSTERALPHEYASIYRLCRAMSKSEQACVRAVADEFFPVGGDGLRHNSRADRDLIKAIQRINKARQNGAHGGRPNKPSGNPAGYESETHGKPSGLSNSNPDHNPAETQRGTTAGYGEALPHATRHAIPSPKEKPGGNKPASLPNGFSVSDRVRDWAAEKGHRRLDERLEHFVGYAKRSGKRYVDWDEAFMSAIREDWAHLSDKPEPPSGRSNKVAL